MKYYSYIYNEVLLIKKKEILPFTPTYTDLEGIVLSEIRQRKTQYDIIYIWTLKMQTM